MANSDDINVQKNDAHATAQDKLDQALPIRDQSPAAMAAYMTLLDARNRLYLADLQAALESEDLAQALAVIAAATSSLKTIAGNMTTATTIISGAANFLGQAKVVVTTFQSAQSATG